MVWLSAILVIFVLGLIAFVVVHTLINQRPRKNEADTITPDYRLCITEDALPYYLPRDGKSDVRIPYKQFVACFPGERKKIEMIEERNKCQREK